MDVSPLNLGMIACFFNVKYTTIELFDSSLAAKTKLKGLVEILSSASEYDSTPMRHGEEKILRKLAAHLPLKIEKPVYSNSSTKVNVLLQSHFSRRSLPADLTSDQASVIETAVRLLQSMVDVISSSSWLSPALAAMELSQMVTQAVWDSDSPLKQLPHMTDELIKKCLEANTESIFDLMEMNDKDRTKLLKMSEKELSDIARASNRYPNVNLSYEIQESDSISSESQVNVNVQLEREIEDNEEVGPVYAPFFPKQKVEGWWLVIGDQKTNHLFCIKRLTVVQKAKVKLSFDAPSPGSHTLKLFFMCDSYTGCDQEYEFQLNVSTPSGNKMEE